MSENLKSKHAFGSETKVDEALANGAIDAYDILFLNEGKIGWIDKNGNKIILNNVSEESLNSKIVEVQTAILEEAKNYADEKVSEAGSGSVEIVEF